MVTDRAGRVIVVILLVTSVVPAGDYVWSLPPGFPEPLVPEDNPMNPEKVELGRYLFYDPRLSVNGELSCAGCHRQGRAFTDGRDRSLGTTGERHPRNAMSLTNVAYNATYSWDDPGLHRLEDQALIPMFNEQPVELGLAGHEEQLLRHLREDARYRRLFDPAFPDEPEPVRIENVTRAIAAFERTLISGRSAYDRLLYDGEMDALSASAWRGMELFFSDRLQCSACHGGFNFSGDTRFAFPAREPPDESLAGPPSTEPRGFFNTGLYDLDGSGAYPDDNPGLTRFTGRKQDEGRFRAPTLRNIGLTAPYMHDGSISTLDEVIDHYAAGGRRRESPLKDPRLGGFELSAGEKADLKAFLHSLTDHGFVADPRFSDPSAGEN